MAPRWRLPKSRVSLDEQPSKTETIQTPRWQDFRFVDEVIPPIRDINAEERPKTSSGVSGRDRSKSRTRPHLATTLARPKTSEGQPPSTSNAAYSSSKLDGDMIGVAFGSPTHPPATFFGNLNDLAPPSNYEESVFEQKEPMYRIKGPSSKWKKLGSLFKGGKSTTDDDDMFEVPFYKVRLDGTPDPEIPVRGRKQHEEAVELPVRRSPTPPPKDNPRRSIDARLAQARLEVARLEEAIAAEEKETIKRELEAANDPSRPKLDLVIPNITLDRYSVMFADLKEIPPHSKLLARRSKKLGRLKPISTEDMKHIDEVPTPDTSSLSPRLALSRRATSPSIAKTTAGFSLFPAASLTPNNTTRQVLTTPSPRPNLQRSATSPARISPRVGLYNTDIKNTQSRPRADSANTITSPGDTTASTDQATPWSAEAPLSPTSTATTIDEDILLSPATTNKINDFKEQYPDANELQHTQFLASPTLPQYTGETPEATTPSTAIDPSQEDEYKIQRVASSVFDAAIAEIEAFGLHSFQEQPPLPSPPSAFVPFVLAADEKVAAIEKPAPAISKSRLMMMNMPSPIREAPEDSPVPSPAKPRTLEPRPRSEITALPQIPEPKRAAPPPPIKLEKPPARKAKGTALPPSILEESPSTSKEKSRARTPSLKREPDDNQRSLGVHGSPYRGSQQAQTKAIDQAENLQASTPKKHGRSNSRQRTGDKVAQILGEVLPAASHAKPAYITSPDSISSPTETIPPAVPTKDSKYVLPISRFAVTGTAAEVHQKSGLQAMAPSPRLHQTSTQPSKPKPTRSVTEPLTTEHMNTSSPRSASTRPRPNLLTRSASDESLRRHAAPKPQYATRGPGFAPSNASNNKLQRMGMERPSVVTVTATAIIKPTPVPTGGEVGVARTISLSRRPSQRILVQRQQKGAGRDGSPDAKAVAAGARYGPHPPPPPAQVVVHPPRSSSAAASRPNLASGPMGNLKRSESFKRAIDVGLLDEEEGDMRSGSLRARALSPDVREVVAGVVVNGHRVMKSSVGVIESV